MRESYEFRTLRDSHQAVGFSTNFYLLLKISLNISQMLPKFILNLLLIQYFSSLTVSKVTAELEAFLCSLFLIILLSQPSWKEYSLFTLVKFPVHNLICAFHSPSDECLLTLDLHFPMLAIIRYGH